MAVFNDVLDELKTAEGGYVNDPSDSGGETKFGISKTTYPYIDISSLTWERAAKIYLADWWNKYRLSEIDSQKIANKLFLALINANVSSVIKRLQEAANGQGKKLQVDGVLGTVTIRAVNSLPERPLLDDFKLRLVAYYLGIVDRDVSKLKYLRSWIRRCL